MRECRQAPFGLVDLIEPALLGGVVYGESAELCGFSPEFGKFQLKPVEVFLVSSLKIGLQRGYRS
ncbi:MAG: hypothetical protein ACREDY_03260, partial [Bradyrhizobium sp.]